MKSRILIRIESSGVPNLAAKVSKFGRKDSAPCSPATVVTGIVAFPVIGTGILSGAFT